MNQVKRLKGHIGEAMTEPEIAEMLKMIASVPKPEARALLDTTCTAVAEASRLQALLDDALMERPACVLVWWTTAQEATEANLHEGVPAYLRGMLVGRRGRPGRGGLWAAAELGLPRAFYVEPTDEERGGILLRAADLRHVLEQPGYVQVAPIRERHMLEVASSAVLTTLDDSDVSDGITVTGKCRGS